MKLWSWLHEMREPGSDELEAIRAAGAQHLRLLAALAQPDVASFEALWCEGEASGSSDDGLALRTAALVAALSSISSQGNDFHQAQAWTQRAQQLLHDEASLPPLYRAGVLLRLVMVELLGKCDLAEVRALIGQIVVAAGQARSSHLLLAQAAASAYAEIMSGHLRRADVLIAEVMPICNGPQGSAVAGAHLRAVKGLLDCLCGNSKKALADMASLCSAADFEALPSQVWMIAMGHRMLALTTGEAPAYEIRQHAERIWQRVVPENNTYHRSYQYYALGLAELAAGHAEDALFHSRMAAELGRTCGSDAAERTPALLSIQALVDLGRDDEAFAALAFWQVRWAEKGAMLLAAAGKLEEAVLLQRQGDEESARQALVEATALLPPDEPLPAHHRPRTAVEALRERLLPKHAVVTSPQQSAPAVQIRAFGSLSISIAGRRLFDRDWHGNRTKVLVKALIVLGGQKVSAERLCDLLWPDADGDKARQNLKVALSRLRRLGNPESNTPIPWLATQHGHVSLVSSTCCVDALEFRRLIAKSESSGPENLVSALALYADDFLAGDDSEPWIITHRDELQRLFVRGAQRLAQTELSGIGSYGAEVFLERALILAPTDDRSYELLIRLHLAAGHPGLAADTYDRARAALLACGRMNPGEALRSLLPESH